MDLRLRRWVFHEIWSPLRSRGRPPSFTKFHPAKVKLKTVKLTTVSRIAKVKLRVSLEFHFQK